MVPDINAVRTEPNNVAVLARVSLSTIRVKKERFRFDKRPASSHSSLRHTVEILGGLGQIKKKVDVHRDIGDGIIQGNFV